MAARDVGSARRGRVRQLRSWLRHERITMRAELAATLHHSAGPKMHHGPRAHMTSNSSTQTLPDAAPAPVGEYVAPTPVVEYITPHPTVFTTSAPVNEYVTSAYVIEYVAPAPALADLLEPPVCGA